MLSKIWADSVQSHASKPFTVEEILFILYHFDFTNMSDFLRTAFVLGFFFFQIYSNPTHVVCRMKRETNSPTMSQLIGQ